MYLIILKISQAFSLRVIPSLVFPLLEGGPSRRQDTILQNILHVSKANSPGQST